MGRGKHRTFRVDDELWERFKEICQEQDLAASQMIRKFIRDLIGSERGSVGNKPPGKGERKTS